MLRGRGAASAALGLAFAYSYFVRSEADGGAAWALAALGDSGSWLFGLVGILFGQAPGGVLALLLALLNLATTAQSARELLMAVTVHHRESNRQPSLRAQPLSELEDFLRAVT